MAQQMAADGPLGASQLRRSIGIWGLAAIVLNGLIGAGIFGFPAALAAAVGTGAPLVTLAVGAAMLAIVGVFTILAGLFDDTGGPIIYTRAAFGDEAAFQMGWMQCFTAATTAAANTNLLADYVQSLDPGLLGDATHRIIVAAALAGVLAINLADARRSSGALILLSVAKLLPLALIMVLAVPPLLGGAAGPGLASDAGGFSKGALLAAFAFTGFENVVTIAGEARAPRRDMPRAIIATFIAVVGVYALLCWAYVAIAFVPGTTDKAPIATLAGMLMGPAGATMVVVTVALSIFGNTTMNIMVLSRRIIALETLGGMPAALGRVDPSNGLPRNAVLMVWLICLALALTGGFVALAVLSVAARMLVYLASVLALPVVRRQRGLPTSAGLWALTAAAVATCLAMLTQGSAQGWAMLAAVVVLGVLCFRLVRASRAAR